MRIRVVVGALALLALVPGVGSAQQTAGVIAGQVRDATGGVLPGVTVEVASPALIERVRSVVTGDDGQYRVVELRPGEYSVTFSLAGFGKLVRENVQLTTGFTATVNAEMKVGDVAETITVTGGSPIVDLQNVTQQSVLSKATLDAIPSGRSYSALGKLVPGMDASGNSGGHDVGGQAGRDANKLMYHGSGTKEFRFAIDGMPQMTFSSDSSVGVPAADNLAEEVNLQYAALPAEVETGGPFYNMVPKTGSNTFRTNFFGNVGTSSMQSNNVTPALVAAGLPTSGAIDYVTDANASFGGPIQRDRLWFFTTYRDNRPYVYSTAYYDTILTDWVYTPDTSRKPAYDSKPQMNWNNRITWQATPRNRVSLGLELSKVNIENFLIGGRVKAPEATSRTALQNYPVVQVGWTVPMSSRLLVDVGGQIYRGLWQGIPKPESSIAPAALETNTGIQLRSATEISTSAYGSMNDLHKFIRGAVSYTTGAHSIKVGTTLFFGKSVQLSDTKGLSGGVGYYVRLTNGLPTAAVYRVDPNMTDTRFFKVAVYAQDQWTLGRLTASYGARIDTQDSGYPAQHEVATAYLPVRDFPAASVVRWRDFSPRLGIVYDLFGNGKTAIKASFSRYVNWDAVGTAQGANPASISGRELQRTWNDRLVCPTCISNDFIPQGDPRNPAANGELSVSPNANWGTPILNSRYDTAWSQGGWGKRGYNWEHSVSVQQELRSNVSVNVGYFDRAYGNFTVVDNVNTSASDYDTFCITGPVDSRLPGGGGARICGLKDLNPAAVSRLQDNVTTLASNYGDIKQNYRGYEAAINVRLPKTLLQGGLSSGRELYDFCGVIDKLPEILGSGSAKTSADQCRQKQPMLTQLKLLGSYELPWALSFAATYQNITNTTAIASNISQGQPRMGIGASYTAVPAVTTPGLGRPLSAGGNATVNVVTPGTMWGDWLQQIDLRFGRTFKAGHASIKAMVDLYNATNTSTITALNNTYGTNGAAWLTPTAILPARVVKLGVQLDF